MSKNTNLAGLINYATADATGTTSTAFKKTGGTAAQILAGDGSVITAGTNVTISGGVLSATGGTSLSGTGFVRMSGTTASYITGTASQFIKADGSLDSSAYLTTITSGQVTTALGFTPYNSTNPNSYVALSSAITGYAVGTNTALAATDSILGAFGKVQAQINAKGAGTVTSVAGTGTVSGLSLSGTVTSSGSLTLGGSLSLTSGQVTSGLGYTPLSTGGGTMTGILTLTDGLGDAAGGMKIITHSVTKVGGAKFLKITPGVNNYFTGFIFAYNFDNYPPNSATSTGAGFTYQFGGYSDGSGACGDKYFDLQWFGGNNVGNMGREMNTDGNGYILTTPTSTGAGGYRVSATIFLFARNMSTMTFTYY